jgi:DnaD/phage-associated family protein
MTEKLRGFAGFAAGKQPTTTIPNLFFSDLLPILDDLAELKVTLHLFWLIGRKQGALRYTRLAELLKDERLKSGLASEAIAGEDALRAALERAVARGTLLHVTVHRAETAEEWYMVNSAAGREVLAKLQDGELDLLADQAEDVQLQMERPTIFVLYEQNIGMLTPMMSEDLREAERRYPAAWIADAFHEAVAANKRSWKYVQAILERWRKEGRGTTRGQEHAPEDAEGRLRYYVPEGYEDLIEH